MKNVFNMVKILCNIFITDSLLIRKVWAVLLIPWLGFICIQVEWMSKKIFCFPTSTWCHSDVINAALRFRTSYSGLSDISDNHIGVIIGLEWYNQGNQSNTPHVDTCMEVVISAFWCAWIRFVALWNGPHHGVLWWRYLRHLFSRYVYYLYFVVMDTLIYVVIIEDEMFHPFFIRYVYQSNQAWLLVYHLVGW